MMRSSTKRWLRWSNFLLVVFTATAVATGCGSDGVAGTQPEVEPPPTGQPVKLLKIRPGTPAEIEAYKSRLLIKDIERWRSKFPVPGPVAAADDGDSDYGARDYYMRTNVWLDENSWLGEVVASTERFAGLAWQVSAVTSGTFAIGTQIPITVWDSCASFLDFCVTLLMSDIDCDDEQGTRVTGQTLHRVEYFIRPSEGTTTDNHRCWRTSSGGHDDYVYENGLRCHYITVKVSTDGGRTWTEFIATECG